MRIKVGDEVLVISGDDSGKKGVVLSVNSNDNRVVVKGVNIVVKHVKKTRERSGDRFEMEAPIHVSNVMLIDNKGNVSRVRYSFDKAGKKCRKFATTDKLVSENFTKK